jgi:hypothetical protein
VECLAGFGGMGDGWYHSGKKQRQFGKSIHYRIMHEEYRE